jgi:hypothetical protein
MRLVSIPKIVQNRPFHLKPATDLGPTKIGKNQKLEPFLSHINVLRNKHIEIAPGSTANGVANCCWGIKAGGGVVGGCCPPKEGNPPGDPGKPSGAPGKPPGGLGGLGNGNCGPKNLG